MWLAGMQTRSVFANVFRSLNQVATFSNEAMLGSAEEANHY